MATSTAATATSAGHEKRPATPKNGHGKLPLKSSPAEEVVEVSISSCIICMEELPAARMVCCGASIHLDCMLQWAGPCPHCRGIVPRGPSRTPKSPISARSLPPLADVRHEDVDEDDEVSVSSSVLWGCPMACCVCGTRLRGARCALMACKRCCTREQYACRYHDGTLPSHDAKEVFDDDEFDESGLDASVDEEEDEEVY